MDSQNEISHALVALMKGVVYKDKHPRYWTTILGFFGAVNSHFVHFGLEVFIDESEGFAFLKQIPNEDIADPLPRLIPKRPLGFMTSLICVLLRKRLAEHDASTSEPRLILTEDDILDMVKAFMPERTNEAKLHDEIRRNIVNVAEKGFLDEMKKAEETTYEVRRIIKAAFNADALVDLDKLLEGYRDYAAATE
jgi:hypothetical protein